MKDEPEPLDACMRVGFQYVIPPGRPLDCIVSLHTKKEELINYSGQKNFFRKRIHV